MSTASPINAPSIELGEGRAVELGDVAAGHDSLSMVTQAPTDIATPEMQVTGEAHTIVTNAEPEPKMVLWQQANTFPFGWGRVGVYKDKSSAKRAERKRRDGTTVFRILPEEAGAPLAIR